LKKLNFPYMPAAPPCTLNQPYSLFIAAQFLNLRRFDVSL
jgi:hypothetical protein